MIKWIKDNKKDNTKKLISKNVFSLDIETNLNKSIKQNSTYDLKRQLVIAKSKKYDIIIDMMNHIKDNTWDKNLCDDVIDLVETTKKEFIEDFEDELFYAQKKDYLIGRI